MEENITLSVIYQKLQAIESEVREINEDLHNIRPEFVEKLKKTEKGRFHRFGSMEEMENAMSD